MSVPHRKFAADEETREDDPRIMREIPWPFENDEFPPDLGAVVMRTVLDGELPALQVIHADDWWGVADGLNDPNGDASMAVHIAHVLELDPSLGELATLPPGYQADATRRAGLGSSPSSRSKTTNSRFSIVSSGAHSMRVARAKRR